MKKTDKTPSPAGFKLLNTAEATDRINRFAWSPNGLILAFTSYDRRVYMWHLKTKRMIAVVGHKDTVFAVDWSPDSQRLASGGSDNSCRIWNASTGQIERVLQDDSMKSVGSVAWSPDGRSLAAGSSTGVVHLWDPSSGKLLQSISIGERPVVCLAWSPNGQMLAASSEADTVHLWNPQGQNAPEQLTEQMGLVYSLAWFLDGRTLLTGSQDSTIRLWNTESRKQVRVIEGHTKHTTSLSFSFDGHYLASKANDKTVRIWRCENWNTVAILNEGSYSWTSCVAFHPTSNLIATYEEKQLQIRVWELDFEVLKAANIETSVHYATAKIALVGDSGVGKTGLGWRLAHNKFKEHPSTHGQQFWVIDELSGKRTDQTECEAVLWDFAGQPDYRLVHSLFLNDVDLALVLFDPANREKPFSGVEFWLKQLSRNTDRVRNAVLVGARIDRGAPTFTRQELEDYCSVHGISGGYVGTSALTGEGLAELNKRIKSQIPWEEMPATVTTTTFKRIKEYVLSLKENTEQSTLLVKPDELRKRLQTIDEDWNFTQDEMMTAVRHLETHGYVTFLRSSAGEQSVLLFPDVLVNLASSFVIEARRNPMGLGVLEEERVLNSGYAFPEVLSIPLNVRHYSMLLRRSS